MAESNRRPVIGAVDRILTNQKKRWNTAKIDFLTKIQHINKTARAMLLIRHLETIEKFYPKINREIELARREIPKRKRVGKSDPTSLWTVSSATYVLDYLFRSKAMGKLTREQAHRRIAKIYRSLKISDPKIKRERLCSPALASRIYRLTEAEKSSLLVFIKTETASL
jgi:hypothetical protein